MITQIKKDYTDNMRSKIAILSLLAAGAALSQGVGIYGHFSPSLPLCEHWFDHVSAYPALESGIAIEFPGQSVFRYRLEGSFVVFPAGGALESGSAGWGGAGIIVRRNLSDAIDASIGPQLLVGFASAKGEYRLEEGDTGSYRIDFDGSGSGVGIGIIGGLTIKPTGHLRVGFQAAVIYFNIKGDVPITGYNLDEPQEPPDKSDYDYRGEYTAFSFRIIVGFEFKEKAP